VGLFVFRLIKIQSDELKPFADAAANLRAILPDAAGEYQRVNSTKNSRVSTQAFPGFVAEERHGICCPRVGFFPGEQHAHVRANL